MRISHVFEEASSIFGVQPSCSGRTIGAPLLWSSARVTTTDRAPWHVYTHTVKRKLGLRHRCVEKPRCTYIAVSKTPV